MSFLKNFQLPEIVSDPRVDLYIDLYLFNVFNLSYLKYCLFYCFKSNPLNKEYLTLSISNKSKRHQPQNT